MSIEIEEGSTICLVRNSFLTQIRKDLLTIVDDEKREIVDELALDTLVNEQMGLLLSRELAIAAVFFSPHHNESECETFVLRPLSNQSADVICCKGANKIVLHRGDSGIFAIEMNP